MSNLLQAAKNRYVRRLEAAKSLDDTNDAWDKFGKDICAVILDQGVRFTFDEKTNDALEAARAAFLDEATNAADQSDNNQAWYRYQTNVASIVKRYLAGRDIPQQEDAVPDDEVAARRPAIAIVQHDVKPAEPVEDAPPPPTAPAFKLQFSFDEDDEPPTPTPPHADYESKVADAWKREVASPRRRTKRRSLAHA